MPKISREAAIAHSWNRCKLNYKLKPEQLKIESAFEKCASKLFVANCSRRLGKTFWACKKAVEVALKNPLPQTRVIYASATKNDLKRFVIPAFEQIFEDAPEEFIPAWRASELLYRFPNGAEIHLVGLDKRPDAGRGNHCDLYVFEEAGYIANLDYLYSSVVFPMTITRKNSRIIMISTPGKTPAHPFKDFCIQAMGKNSYIELTIDENTSMTAAEKKEALDGCLTKSDRDREYYCQHVVSEDLALCPEWSSQYEQQIVRPEYFAQLHRYVAMDLGTKIDLTAILYGYYNRLEERLYVEAEDEITGPKMTSQSILNLVREKERALWPNLPEPYRRVADNDNPLLLQDLSILHGLHFMATGKDELKAMVDQVRVMVKNGRIVVSPLCQKTLGCLRYGLWNSQRTKFDRHATYGHYDHFAALVYLVRNIDLYGDPIDTASVWKERLDKETPSEKAARIISGLD